MSNEDLEQRVARLEDRLVAIERQLGVAPDAPAAPPPIVTPAPLAPIQAIPEWIELPAPTLPPPLPRMPPRAALPVRPSAGALETQVGLKWAGWVGAIVVVIGAALGIKYAYDNHWFEAVSPTARLALMSLGGFALIAAGEIVYRRIGAMASAGLFGAGVATLFVVSYGGYGIYHLYERDAAFVGMGLVTLIGAAVAMRGGLVSIAVLSIVGGNVAPIVLHSDRPNVPALLAYLLMLQVVALSLAWWGREPKWWSLRGVSFATVCLWLAAILIDPAAAAVADHTIVLAFSIIYAVLFHGELIASCIRGMRPRTTREPAFAVPVPLGETGFELAQSGLGVTFSLFVTAALTIAILVLRADRTDLERGVWTLGLAGACLVLGLLLVNRDRKSDFPSSVYGLSIGYRIQSAALVVVSAAVLLSGVWLTTAWAAMALAFAVAGARFNLSLSRVAAFVVWFLAVGHLLVWTVSASIGGGGGGPMATWAMVFGTPIPAYTVLAAGMTLVGHAIASLLREDWTRQSAAALVAAAHEAQPPDAAVHGEPEPPVGASAAGAGAHDLHYENPTTPPPRARALAAFQSLAATLDVLCAVVFVLATVASLPSVGLTLAVLCYGWVLIATAPVLHAPPLQPIGLLLIGLAAGKWLLNDTLAERLSGRFQPSTYAPVYNPVAAIGVALVVSGIALLRIPLRAMSRSEHDVGPKPERIVRSIGGFAAVLILLWLVTLEIDRYFTTRGGTGALVTNPARAEQFVLSIFWSAYAVGCVALGFAIRIAGLRYFGLALLALTLLKVMLVDLSSVQTGYRILSFLGLGLLLLGTSVLYGKLSPVLLRETEKPLEPAPRA